jgi:hypothetical protein
VDTFQAHNPEIVIRDRPHGQCQEPEYYTFFFGVFDLFEPGRKLRARAAVHDGRLSAQAQGGPGAVHGNIAAAQYGHLPMRFYRRDRLRV